VPVFLDGVENKIAQTGFQKPGAGMQNKYYTGDFKEDFCRSSSFFGGAAL